MKRQYSSRKKDNALSVYFSQEVIERVDERAAKDFGGISASKFVVA